LPIDNRPDRPRLYYRVEVETEDRQAFLFHMRDPRFKVSPMPAPHYDRATRAGMKFRAWLIRRGWIKGPLIEPAAGAKFL